MKEGWKEVRLGDIIDIKHGYAFKGKFFTKEKTSNYLITPGNFLIGGGFKNDKMKYYDGPIPENYILSKGDMIITMTDLSKEADTLGYSAKIPRDNKNKYLHNQRIGLISIIDKSIDKEFIYWLLRTQSYQGYVAGSSTGATVKHTSPKKIYSYKVKVPKSKTTQQKIANILSSYDDLIENNSRRIALLEEQAQQTYEEWFVRMRFPGFEEVEVVDGLPFGWRKVKISKVLKNQNGKTFKGNYDIKGKFSVYGSNGIIGKSNYSNRKEAIIIGRIGAYCGSIKYCKQEFWATDNTITSTSISDRMPNYLAFFILKELNLRNFAGGSAQPLLTQRLINNLEITLPNIDLAIKFKNKIHIIFETILNLQAQNRLLQEARDILLPRLMLGIVDPEKMSG